MNRRKQGDPESFVPFSQCHSDDEKGPDNPHNGAQGLRKPWKMLKAQGQSDDPDRNTDSETDRQ
ncbi:MAG: hypothetical protein K2Y27_15365 [Xanthobacteraceae bacterium]|nr:hypothetical protein [Xanthobacteraceae bacterium]